MRKVLRQLLILLYWLIGKGPWIVVGQYHDDDGNLCRFRTGCALHPDGLSYMTFDTLDEANAYCDRRNEQAAFDPLGSIYYVWHLMEFNYFHNKEKR